MVFLGTVYQYPSDSKSNWLHVDVFQFCLFYLRYILLIPPKRLENFLKSWTSTVYFSYSTGSSATNRQFFPNIAWECYTWGGSTSPRKWVVVLGFQFILTFCLQRSFPKQNRKPTHILLFLDLSKFCTSHFVSYTNLIFNQKKHLVLLNSFHAQYFKSPNCKIKAYPSYSKEIHSFPRTI